MNKISKKKLTAIIGLIVAILTAVIVIVILFHSSNDSTQNIERENYHTVSFETNGGEKIESQFVSHGSLIDKPTDPNRDGYDFAGWFSDRELTIVFDFSEPIKEDLILYAKWNNKPEAIEDQEARQQTQTQKTPTKSIKQNTANSNSGQNKPTTNPQYAPNTVPEQNLTPTPVPEPMPVSEPIYKIVVVSVDPYSPDVKITVTKDGTLIPFSSIKVNGHEICNASNPYTSRNELSSLSYDVTLITGEVVTANL